MNVRLGGFGLLYRGVISVADRTPDGYRLQIAAETDGGAVDADVSLCFLPLGSGTRVEYAADFTLRGSQRLQPALARALVDFFMHGMKEYAAKCRRVTAANEHTPE